MEQGAGSPPSLMLHTSPYGLRLMQSEDKAGAGKKPRKIRISILNI